MYEEDYIEINLNYFFEIVLWYLELENFIDDKENNMLILVVFLI